jgi:Uma2 family endonuclease
VTASPPATEEPAHCPRHPRSCPRHPLPRPTPRHCSRARLALAVHSHLAMLGAHSPAGSTLTTPTRKVTLMSPHGARAASLAHLRVPVPLRFPESAEMPEGTDHLILRTFLYQLVGHVLGPEHTVGSDQFLYWLPTNPRRCVAPDVLVKLGVAQHRFGSWKCWERGAPDLAVEIISPNEGDGIEWDEKLARYHECGVLELVRFDPAESVGERLRAWDRVNGDLVERVTEGDRTPCVTLGLHWRVSPVEQEPVGLRLVREDGSLVLNDVESAARGRELAETRIRELEAELAKLRG